MQYLIQHFEQKLKINHTLSEVKSKTACKIYILVLQQYHCHHKNVDHTYALNHPCLVHSLFFGLH